ncbi:MAG: hypothetical protein KKC80_02640 [Candidatus Margulisbacteria bacterium]|nr:hypothetical protein [Candidatus Margulisiibacteriota bacterium]MBU1617309.1 hypothetical protein [Candidatus Margulisiibacteriota bacterium]MBU1867625.1 hypothetical protein [Candidatus Margulisiibacteriota bacterium]
MRVIKWLAIILVVLGLTGLGLADTLSGTGYLLGGGTNYYGGAPSGGGLVSSSVGDYYQTRPMSGGSYLMASGPFASVWSFAPWLLTLEPASGYNIAPIRVKISGANFLSSTTVRLTHPGQSDIPGTNMTIGASEIYCDFNIAGALTGLWTVEVADINGLVGILPDGFEVKSFAYDIALILNSPNPFDPARESTTIMYKLNSDANVTAVIFSMTADRLWRRDYLAGTNGGRSGDNSLVWNGISDFGEMASNGVYLVHVIDKSSGKTLARGKVAVIRR